MLRISVCISLFAILLAIVEPILVNNPTLCKAFSYSLDEKVFSDLRAFTSFTGKIQTRENLSEIIRLAKEGRLKGILNRYEKIKTCDKKYSVGNVEKLEIASFLARAISLADIYGMNAIPLLQVENRLKSDLREKLVLSCFYVNNNEFYQKDPLYFAARFKALKGEKLVNMVFWFSYTRLTTRYSVSDNPDFREAFRRRSGDCSEFAQLNLYFLRSQGIPAVVAGIQTGRNVTRDIHLLVIARINNNIYLLDQYGLSRFPRNTDLKRAFSRHVPVKKIFRIVELDTNLFLEKGILFINGPLREFP